MSKYKGSKRLGKYKNRQGIYHLLDLYRKLYRDSVLKSLYKQGHRRRARGRIDHYLNRKIKPEHYQTHESQPYKKPQPQSIGFPRASSQRYTIERASSNNTEKIIEYLEKKLDDKLTEKLESKFDELNLDQVEVSSESLAKDDDKESEKGETLEGEFIISDAFDIAIPSELIAELKKHELENSKDTETEAEESEQDTEKTAEENVEENETEPEDTEAESEAEQVTSEEVVEQEQVEGPAEPDGTSEVIPEITETEVTEPLSEETELFPEETEPLDSEIV